MGDRKAKATIAVAALVYLGAFFTSLSLLAANASEANIDVALGDVVLAASFVTLPLAGAFILWHRPTNRTGALLLSIGFASVAAVLGTNWAAYGLRANSGSLPGGEIAAWVSTWTLVLGFGLAPWFFATFPSGRIETGWLRLASRPAVAALIAAVLVEAFAPEPIDGVPAGFRPIENPLGAETASETLATISGLAVTILVAFALASILDLVLRYRRSTGEVRQQLRWMAIALPVLPVAMVFGVALPRRYGDLAISVGQPIFLAGTASGVAIAVLKHRLYELDLFVRRSLLFGALTASVVLGYAGAVAFVGAVLDDRNGSLPSFVAAGVVAVAFQPARVFVQRGVDRLVYGKRSEPYAVLSALGAELETAIAPDDALRAIVTTIRSELQLPGVAIDLADGQRVACAGDVAGAGQRFAVTSQGRQLGDLVVTPRTPNEPFTEPERRLLTDLARQAAAPVQARQLTAALQRSREQIVNAREEDRRQLRRDLHDGLGPTLAGLLLKADVAADLVDQDSLAARELHALKDQLRDATVDVRRLVHGLRPPALDELGLVPAVRAQAEALSRESGGAAIEVLSASDLPTLSAATEVALYRIAAEAMTNVVRHANATSCRVTFCRTPRAVELRVEDDGIGLADSAMAGVGQQSMKERAAELGGTVSLGRAATGGTVVHVSIPMATT